MSNQHPIVPSPDLVEKWARLCSPYGFARDIARQAAQWGADQQLGECCEQLKSIPSPLGIPFGEMASNALRNACRPQPPSLKEQALEVLNITQKGYGLAQVDLDTIRKALEALPND